MVDARFESHIGINDALIDGLEKAIASVQSADHGVPFLPLMDLSRLLPDAVAVHVDYSVASRLSAPLVVITRDTGADVEAISASLTTRERQVARLLVQGHSNKHIARALGLSPGTVKLHVHHILSKTGCVNRASFVARHRRVDEPG